MITTVSRFALGAVLLTGVVLGAGNIGIDRALQGIPVDADDLAGVVTGPSGPEAGVWVIAETTELPTKFVRIVVTDDRGRYLVPDLPRANYSVWVRGYGLVDSPKLRSMPGRNVNLTAVPAPNAKAAAEYYPAGYWWSLLQVPPASDFPGTGVNGNGLSANFQNQAALLRTLKSGGCWACRPTGCCRRSRSSRRRCWSSPRSAAPAPRRRS